MIVLKAIILTALVAVLTISGSVQAGYDHYGGRMMHDQDAYLGRARDAKMRQQELMQQKSNDAGWGYSQAHASLDSGSKPTTNHRAEQKDGPQIKSSFVGGDYPKSRFAAGASY